MNTLKTGGNLESTNGKVNESKAWVKSLSSVTNVVCIGIGGGGVFYVAKFFNLLGTKVTGYDIFENDRVKEIRQLGIDVILQNPEEPFSSEIDLLIYSSALPQKLQDKIKQMNPKIKAVEVGEFYDKLVHAYEFNQLNESEQKAFIESEIAPLYKLDNSKMLYVGVTGTDGKTTTSTMIYHALKYLGYKPALISTVSAKIGDEEIDTGFHTTTPSSQELYKLIKKVEEAKCSHVIIESTSHGLKMGRLAGIKFDAVAYTNITKEHLDYHGSWENLVVAKALLITERLKPEGFSVINLDDESYSKLHDLNENQIAYSCNRETETSVNLVASSIVASEENLRFNLSIRDKFQDFIEDNLSVILPILGEYNVSNALAAMSVCYGLGEDIYEVVESFEKFETVVGRMQLIQESPFKVIVDFAHTPNAMEQALKSAASLKASPENKLIVVFGCAGQRDASKREPMGKFAGEYADVAILTAEDPRSENLLKINDEIAKGWNSVNSSLNEDDRKAKKLIRFDDESKLTGVRQSAIEKALELANPGDVVIITGKAHEKSLCFGAIEYPWNDIEAVSKLLEESK